MKNLLFLLGFIWMSTISYSQIKVGEHLKTHYESPHPYAAAKSVHPEVVWTQNIELEDKKSAYIAAHFSKFRIEDGDQLLLKNSNGNVVWTYGSKYNDRNEFWSIPVYGYALTLELISINGRGNYGYAIDKITKGINQVDFAVKTNSISICEEDDTEAAKCYIDSESSAYQKSTAVVRIWRNTDIMEPHCTGWFFGSEGHIISAGHCGLDIIQNQNEDVVVERLAEGECGEPCMLPEDCPGEFIGDNIEVIREVDDNSTEIDYVLFKIPDFNPQGQIFLQARASGAQLGERIYIPQHPLGYGKRIALVSDSPNDLYGFPELSQLENTITKVGHFADTESKSSGSPVISYDENVVVALHTKGGCPNKAIDIKFILDDLESANLIPEDAVWERSCEKKQSNKIVNTHETWNYMRWIGGDIFIKAPGQLTLQSTIFLTPGSTIFVERGAKLIIDGGTISSCGEERWNGIIVEGAKEKAGFSGQLDDPFDPTDNTYAGTVIIQNGGTIDNAINGISTNNTQHSWGLRPAYRGGLIYCNDANFTNCFRAVEFFPYGHINNLDKSSFHNTNFKDLTLGVTNWASDGVTFTQCHFENIERSATGGHNAAINVYDGNEFINVGTGVSLVATRVNAISSIIGMAETEPNRFFSGDIGIWSDAVNNSEQTHIQNNNFFCKTGISLDGINLALIERNDFQVSNIGVLAYDSKNQIIIRNNEFIRNETAIHTIGDNSDLTFLNNCMENTIYEDVWIYGDAEGIGSIDLEQGDEGFGSGNCFSKQLIPDIYTDGNTQPFEYFVEDVATTNCLYPEYDGNFIISQAFSTADEDCGSEGNAPPPVVQFCILPQDILGLLSEIQTLDEELLILKNQNGNLLTINEKERCLDQHLRRLAHLYAENEDYLMFNTFFANRPEFQMRIIPFSNYIYEEDYTSARTYLFNLLATTEEEIDYKAVALLYLNYLETEEYVLNNTDKLFLETAGVQSGPLYGYARAVYHLITGQRIELNLPARNRANRFEENDKKESIIRIYPNPSTRSEINILGVDETLTLEIFDALGNRVLYNPAFSRPSIDLPFSFHGVYFLKLSKEKDIKLLEKLILL